MRATAIFCTALAAVLALAGAGSASAHPMPNSVLALDVHADSIAAELQIPVDDLTLASGIDLRNGDADAVLTARRDDLRRYVAGHLRATAPDGRAWSTEAGAIRLTEAESTATGTYREVVAEAVLTPPPGAPVRQFTLAADPVVHQVLTHSIVVTVRTDWAGGRVSESGEARQIGVIVVNNRTMRTATMPVDLDDGGMWQGFTAMLRLGGDHILAGTDHLLFLLVLLLPAPLAAAGRRWRGPVGTRHAIARITAITLAFTLGHSATLALAALGRSALPAAPVESLIALSIFVGAVHALRPLFPGREALVAAAFGLVHGLAFSFTLAELDLATPQLVVSLLGFNLGIELVQLLIVALVLPCLLVLARTRWYTAVRVTGAVAAAVAAVGWLLDRIGIGNVVAEAADRIGATGGWLLAGLVVVAVLSTRIAPEPQPVEDERGTTIRARLSTRPLRPSWRRTPEPEKPLRSTSFEDV